MSIGLIVLILFILFFIQAPIEAYVVFGILLVIYFIYAVYKGLTMTDDDLIRAKARERAGKNEQEYINICRNCGVEPYKTKK